MAQFNTATTLSAMFKEIYADSVENLIPDGVKLLKKVAFAEAEKELGDKYVAPVQLSHEHGFSYGTGVFDLNNSIAAQYEEAQVQGTSLLLRTAIGYSAAARMSNSKKAFVKWSELVVKSMVNSMAKRLEIQCLYGQSSGGIGRITGAPVVAPATQAVCTMTTAEYAAGIWAGSEGMELDAYDTTGATLRNDSSATAVYTVTEVDLTARTVTVTGESTDIAALADTDVFYFRGAKATEGNGLDKIVTNTGSLYNIDASVYSLWKGNSYGVAGALSFAKIQEGLALAVERGLEEAVCLMVNPKAWADLMSDQAALRQYDSKYSEKESKNGSEEITFYGQNGMIEIVPSIYVKEGEAFAFPAKKCKRLGSTDVTFKLPGKSEEEIFLQLPSQAGYELRAYSEQNFFVECPATTVKFTGIS